jgi:putative ABC transport system ATP-binding protein
MFQGLPEEKNVSPRKQNILSETISPTNQSQALIQLRQVYKVYETAAGDFPALRGISADIYPGEFLGVIGKSGAGKSTLMNMITGVDHLTSGEVIIHRDHESVSIHTLTEDELALWRGRSVGVVYQSFQLLPMLTLVENIMLPMDFCGLYNRSESRARALELLRMVELEEHANKLPNYISGGQQQRVAIARALANDPPILVADEPTGSLDSMTADHVFEVFERLIKDGKTIIMVTHDNSLAPRFSRHLVIQDGEIIPDAVPRNERRHSLAPSGDHRRGQTVRTKTIGIRRDGTQTRRRPGVPPPGRSSLPARSKGKP